MAYKEKAPIPVVEGGTGAQTLTGVLTGTGTSAFTASAVTQHDVLVGGTSNAITSVAPSATSGIPLVSNGASADPSFTTAVVAGGGTGDTSFTAYAPVCGGTTTTGALQSASTGISTSGFVLTSTGSSSLPTFQALPASGGVTVTTFTASGTWTKGASTKYVHVYGWNSGGGGGAGGRGTSSGAGGGGGGGAGSCFHYEGVASIFGATETVTVGATSNGGAAQTANNTAGANGSASNLSAFGNMSIPVPALSFGAGGSLDGSTVVGGVSGPSYVTLGATYTIGNGGIGGNNGTPGGTAAANSGTTNQYITATAGGGGSGYDASGSIKSGGAGGKIVGMDNSTVLLAGGTLGTHDVNGGDGNPALTTGGVYTGGTGGGGGGGQNTTSPGHGGAGGIPGGGGGGGGGSDNGIASGAGGNGARGQVVVIEFA